MANISDTRFSNLQKDLVAFNTLALDVQTNPSSVTSEKALALYEKIKTDLIEIQRLKNEHPDEFAKLPERTQAFIQQGHLETALQSADLKLQKLVEKSSNPMMVRAQQQKELLTTRLSEQVSCFSNKTRLDGVLEYTTTRKANNKKETALYSGLAALEVLDSVTEFNITAEEITQALEEENRRNEELNKGRKQGFALGVIGATAVHAITTGSSTSTALVAAELMGAGLYNTVDLTKIYELLKSTKECAAPIATIAGTAASYYFSSNLYTTLGTYLVGTAVSYQLGNEDTKKLVTEYMVKPILYNGIGFALGRYTK